MFILLLSRFRILIQTEILIAILSHFRFKWIFLREGMRLKMENPNRCNERSSHSHIRRVPEKLLPRLLRIDMATTSMRSSTTVGYWGPPTSTIDWCESNYEHSYYIAEFWNTISNSLFVLLGLYGLYRSIKMGFEPRFHLQFIGVMVTGFGSAMFHGTLQHVYQQCDETPMVWSILAWLFIVYNNEIEQIPIKNASNYVIAFLTTIGVIFTVVHAIYRFTTVFQVFFGILAILGAGRLCMHYAEVKDPRARAVARSYVTSSLIGFVFWMMDYHYCHIVRGLPVNPQGHAWWHVFMGISTYHGPIFMQYVRMEQLKKKVHIHDTGIGIQTIVVEDNGMKKPKQL